METDNEYSKIGPTAFGQAYLKSVCGIPYAKEISDLLGASKNYGVTWQLNTQGQKEVALFTEIRYKGTELVMKKYIKEQNITQIVELAAGLSPQGIILSEDFLNVKYLETDLPEMIETKKQIMQNLHKENIKNIYFSGTNALNYDELEKSLEIFDKNKKIIITATGFLSYLSIEEKGQQAEIAKKILSDFGGYFITPDLSGHKERRRGMYTKESSQESFEKKMKEVTTRGYEECAFENEEETVRFYKNMGFNVTTFPQIQDYKLACTESLNFKEEDVETVIKNIKDFGKVWVFSI